MSDLEALAEAKILIDSYGSGSPLVQLAQLASPACRIEPQLLRQLRLECVPQANVSVEQQLWFSELADSRGTTLTFRESVAQELRSQLRNLCARQPELVRRARDVMTDLHSSLTPLLILEDKLAWAEVFDDDDSIRTGAQELLASLLAGRDGLDQWLGRAWGVLPGKLKRLPEGQKLAQVAASRGAEIEEHDDAPVLDEVAHALPSVLLPLRRTESRLQLNVRPSEATHAIDIPDTRPRAVAVESAIGSEQVVFGASQARGLDVGLGEVTLRTLSGSEYRLEAIDTTGTRLFEIEMLPAEHGASLLIRYGDESSPHRVLVDCGPRRTGRLLRRRFAQDKPEARKLELLVLTHIDDDRIGGALELLGDDELQLQIRDVWFNDVSQFRSSREELL